MTKRLLIPFIASAVLAGCGGAASDTTSTSAGEAQPGASGSSQVLVGAGSTFVFPLVSKWTGDYAKATKVTVTYGAVGSGGGIAAITDRSVDFGASDAPLSTDQVAACNDCLQIPWALGATAVVYNVDGAPDHLKLDGPTLARIFLGKIDRWNDPAITSLNPGASLPDEKIVPVFRSDSSGTSYNFTDYLSSVSPAFKKTVGVSTQPSFPAGQGAKGSSGVAGTVSHSRGAVTYVDVAYAKSAGLHYAAVRNAAGSFVLPDVAATKAAAAAARSPRPNAAISIVNPPASAAKAYPIATFTYVIVPKRSPKAAALRAFLTYAVTDGQAAGRELLFAPLPDAVVAADKTAIAQIG